LKPRSRKWGIGYNMVKKSAHAACSSKPKFAIVVAKFNEFITSKLLKACLNEFSRHGVCECEIQVVWVPGAFELPVTALKLAGKKNIQVVICFGAVIKGETLHYDLVARESARGIMDVSIKTGKPVVFEVLAADTVKLCEARAKDGDRDNKGASAARVLLDMVKTFNNLRG
jgi:6,7-dimethyl-8-ribityllumazine synthase